MGSGVVSPNLKVHSVCIFHRIGREFALADAAREVTQESTGFSPNELVFSHIVRGPLDAVSANWQESQLPKNLIDYVNGLQRRFYTGIC